MVMTAHGAGGFMPSGPEMGMYVQQTIIPPVQESKLDVGDVDMMDSERDVKTVKTSQRRTRRKDRRPDTSSDDESSDDSHYSRRREWGRRRSSKRTSGRHRSTSGYSERSNRSGYSVKSTGSTVAAMEFMQKMAESMTEMKDSMASVVEKVAQVQKQSARVEKENVPPLISSNVANFVPMSPEVGEALRAEAALNERQRMEAALGDFQAQLESEKNRQALEVAEEKARLESEGKRQALELEATRKELLALQEARERDREAAINVQKYYASQLREKRAATTQPNPRVEVPMPSQVPAQTAQTTADNHFSAQLQATLRNFQQAKVKNDAASGSRSATQVKTEQSSEKRSPPGRTPPGGSDPPKKDAGKSGSSRRSSARRISKRGNDPHDSDPDSDSDKRDDESSDDSDSSFFEESVPSAMTSKTSQAGTTVFTYKRYVNASALEDFNEKSSLSTRIRWLEKFQSMAVQGGWSDKMRIYEMKLKLPSSARDWRYNLDEDVRHSWKRFLKALKEKYCKAKTSDSERYYSMTQKKTEAPLEFFYRLNRVADKAGINFRKSSKERDRHFKVFMKKLLDSSLRSTLQGQRLHSLEDLEFVLKQYEEMHQDDDYETPPLDVNLARTTCPLGSSAQSARPRLTLHRTRLIPVQRMRSKCTSKRRLKRSQSKKWRQGRRRVNFRKIGRKCIEQWRTPVGNLLPESSDPMTHRHDLANHRIRPDSARRASVLDITKIAVGPDSSVIDVISSDIQPSIARHPRASSVQVSMEKFAKDLKSFRS
ncbi:hypothetical protein PF003_g13322 [Phytophthora fragariae]|uniref:Retrotransposon gag domain-containing protein n=3 Tax=Phytophthora fragariae TaxID=53985 RepID=A0A6A3E018_9STRA|nr:hypothetical protein PF003_g13322 [Phytophthora fragariae]KAE8927309.1 hypothetical protein PF009_g22520 [Phytophthora fragariae]